MGTIADKLQKLLGTKEAIRQAIIEKGQDVADSDAFASYPEKIAAIQTGTDTSDATATAADLLSGKTAYGPRGKLTGAVAGVAQAAPVIAVSDGGLITASVTQDAGLLAPDSDNFAEIYGMNIAEGESQRVSFALPSGDLSFKVTNETSMEDMAKTLNKIIPNFGYTAAYNAVTGKLVITDWYGAVADLTVTDKDGTVLEPKYTAVKSATQQLASFTPPLPTISVSSGGLITASAATSKGYYPDGSNSATKQLTTQGAATITPGTSAKTAVASGRYTTGAVTVAGDANLAAGNIRSGVSIFGVAGSYTGQTVRTQYLSNIAVTRLSTTSIRLNLSGLTYTPTRILLGYISLASIQKSGTLSTVYTVPVVFTDDIITTDSTFGSIKGYMHAPNVIDTAALNQIFLDRIIVTSVTRSGKTYDISFFQNAVSLTGAGSQASGYIVYV